MKVKKGKGELKLTAGLVTAVLIISVAVTAIFLTWALFSRHDDIVLEVEQKTTEAEEAINPLEIISPYEQQTLTELSVENAGGRLVFQPDSRRRWQLREPKIRYQNKSLLEENLFLLTNLRGQPLSSTQTGEAGMAKAVAGPPPLERFDQADFILTYRNVDGSAKRLNFLKVPNKTRDLFACYEGEEQIWLVKDLTGILETDALAYLNPHLLSRDLDTVKAISFKRSADALEALAIRVDQPLLADQNPAWEFQSPVFMRANSYNLNALIREFLDLEAARYIALGKDNLEHYGLAEPAFYFRLDGTENGEDYQDEIYLGEAENGRLFGYSSYQNAIFSCGAGSIQMTQSDLLDLLDRYPIRVPFSTLSQLEVVIPGQTLTIARSADVGENVSALSAGESPDLKADGVWLYNGEPATWLTANDEIIFRRFYRSLARISVSEVEPTLPEVLPETQCYIHLVGTEQEIEVELRGDATGPLYLFTEDNYTGLLCDRAVLNRSDRDNCGILLALELLAEEADQVADE